MMSIFISIQSLMRQKDFHSETIEEFVAGLWFKNRKNWKNREKNDEKNKTLKKIYL